MKAWWLGALLVGACWYHGTVCLGGVKTWVGGSGADWSTGANWDPSGEPADGDSVSITNAGANVLLTNSTKQLASLTLTNATLTCSNWFTTVFATNITLWSNGVLTAAGSNTTSQMSNRVSLVCDTLTVEAGGRIDMDGKGFAGGADWGGTGVGTAGYGPGKGGSGSTSGAPGAGYGGKGGKGALGTPGVTNGSPAAPIGPGSGGGGGYRAGGAGGGAIVIEANALTVHGTITANGAVGATTTDSGGDEWGGCGSGGGILLMCNVFEGVTGASVRANGGTCEGCTGTWYGGGGGGGRIAVAMGLTAGERAQLIAGQDVARLTAFYLHSPFEGQFSVREGLGWDNTSSNGAQPGTWRYLMVVREGTNALTILGIPEAQGTPLTPPAGYDFLLLDSDTWATNSVASPVYESNGARWACADWTAASNTGGTVYQGVGTQAVFRMTADLTLTWRWTNEYRLAVTSAAPDRGSVTMTVNGWYTNGTVVTGILATPDAGYRFNRWMGAGVPPGSATNNPLTATMDRYRSIQAAFSRIGGETIVWEGSNVWTSMTNWTPVGVPAAEDTAIVRTGTVTLAESWQVGGLVVSNGAALMFTNWATVLTVGAGVVRSNGVITSAGPFTTSQMSNRVNLVCNTLVVEAGGRIDADGKGFAGGAGYVGMGVGAAGYGPGKGGSGSTSGAPGAGHGGKGGKGITAGTPGVTNGSPTAPTGPGSGGGGGYRAGGAGGGAIVIEANALTMHGTITANGAVGATTTDSGGDEWGGCGSGGGILLICNVFEGATGAIVRANGGTCAGCTAIWYGGGGGGGRVAVWTAVPQVERERYLAGQTNTAKVRVSESSAAIAAVFSVTNGLGYTNTPPDAAEPGTMRFFNPLPAMGTVILLQ